MGWEWISETEPRARKGHRCVWCGELVKVGERYARITGTYYGCFQNDAYHCECNDAAKRYFSESDEDEITPGDFMRGSTRNRWD